MIKRYFRVSIDVSIIASLFLFSCNKEEQTINNHDERESVSVSRVYGDGSTYCAFTSLVKRGLLYCF